MIGKRHSALFKKALATVVCEQLCQKDHKSYASVSARQMLNGNWREKGVRPILVVCTSKKFH